MKVTEVFVPNGVPTHTYINRDSKGTPFEDLLRTALQQPNFLVSLNGPSKTGKSVLCKKAVGEKLILVSSLTDFKSPAELWDLVLRRLGVPEKKIVTKEASGSVCVFNAGGGLSLEYRCIESACDKLVEFGKVLVIDDFHYLERVVQSQIGKNIKHAIEKGAKIVVICVSYRHDDAVRSNQDLAGRYKSIDIPTWDKSTLSKIVRSGFQSLNYSIGEEVIDRIAVESLGSPHLTQHLCLELCNIKKISESSLFNRKLDIVSGDIDAACREVARSAGIKNDVEKLLQGPKVKGNPRKVYTLKDGSTGDVYKVLLKVIALDPPPPKLKFTYSEINKRAREVCNTSPFGSSLQGAAEQMSKIAAPSAVDYSAKTFLEWDSNVLYLPNPFFVFYLRWSDILKEEQIQ